MEEQNNLMSHIPNFKGKDIKSLSKPLQIIYEEADEGDCDSTNDGKDVAKDDENSDDENFFNDISCNLRGSLKIVRDPSKNAFDYLSTGETIGAFANKHAVDRYARKVENKRERARETRKKKRTLEIIYKTEKKRKLTHHESQFLSARENLSC